MVIQPSHSLSDCQLAVCDVKKWYMPWAAAAMIEVNKTLVTLLAI